MRRPEAAAIRVGVAGWSIPPAVAERFPDAGTHLARYAQGLSAVEINSSFYRPHRRATYERWSATVPQDFRFSVKTPKAITHERRLVDVDELLDRFLDEIAGLGAKLGPVLVQLPPSLAFDPAAAERFFEGLRERFAGQAACEPRHATWFTDAADALLSRTHIARVAADPALNARAASPGGWPGLAYWRWHGSPRLYYSDYPPEALATLAQTLRRTPPDMESWCVFDNTALGFAAIDALIMNSLLAAGSGPPGEPGQIL